MDHGCADRSANKPQRTFTTLALVAAFAMGTTACDANESTGTISRSAQSSANTRPEPTGATAPATIRTDDESPPTSAPAGDTWGDYFPVTPGTVCTTSYDGPVSQIATWTMTERSPTSDGEQVRLHQKIDTWTADGPHSFAEDDLSYVFNRDGSLGVPEMFKSLDSLHVTIDKAVVYPPISEMITGDPVEQTMRMTVPHPSSGNDVVVDLTLSVSGGQPEELRVRSHRVRRECRQLPGLSGPWLTAAATRAIRANGRPTPSHIAW